MDTPDTPDTPEAPETPETPRPVSPRQRMQQLLAIPERERTDAQWDELNELEIQLASVIRSDAPPQGERNRAPMTPGQPRPAGGSQGRKSFKKFHKKRRGGNAP